jgi:hypothetical protein
MTGFTAAGWSADILVRHSSLPATCADGIECPRFDVRGWQENLICLNSIGACHPARELETFSAHDRVSA